MGYFDFDMLDQQGDDLYLDPRPGRGNFSDRPKIRFIPRDTPVHIQFLSSFSTMDEDHGWLKYETARCDRIQCPGIWSPDAPYAPKEGKRARALIPHRLHEVPVDSYTKVFDDALGRSRLKKVNDVITVGAAELSLLDTENYSEVLDASSQYKPRSDGRVKTSWSWLTNVRAIEDFPTAKKSDGTLYDTPQRGDVFLVELGSSAGQELYKIYKQTINMNPDFDLTAYTYRLTVHSGKEADPRVTLVRVGPAEPYTGDLIDTVEVVDTRREEFIAYVNAAFADYHGIPQGPDLVSEESPLAKVAAAAERESVAATATNVFDTAAAQSTAAKVAPAPVGSGWEMVEPVKIKKLLTDAGVEVRPRIPRVELHALAVKHLGDVPAAV